MLYKARNYLIGSYIHTLIRNNHVCYRFPFWTRPLVRLSQTLSDIHVIKISYFSMLNNLITHLKCVHHMICCLYCMYPFLWGDIYWLEMVWCIFWLLLIGINLTHQNLDESIGRFTKPLWRGTTWYYHPWWLISYYTYVTGFVQRGLILASNFQLWRVHVPCVGLYHTTGQETGSWWEGVTGQHY